MEFAWIIYSIQCFMVWHILDMTEKANNVDNRTIQISRIDFDKPFDSLSTIDIENKLASFEGVKKRITVIKNVVVYRHDNTIANSKKVFDELMAKGNYKANQFVLPANLVGKEVCPAMKKDGFYYNYTQLVLRIFN